MHQTTLIVSALMCFGSVFSASYGISNSNKVVDSLRKGGIIPGILPDNFKPTTDLMVTYVGRPMKFGTEYFPYKNETDSVPKIKYNYNSKAFYTLALIDPDAPSRADPFRAQVRHWLSVNIPANKIASGNSTGTPYLPPRPFPGCGRKRFVYVLARQPKRIPGLSVPAARPNFNVVDFAKQHNMKLIGANYFEVESEPGPTCTIPGTNPTTTATTSSTRTNKKYRITTTSTKSTTNTPTPTGPTRTSYDRYNKKTVYY